MPYHKKRFNKKAKAYKPSNLTTTVVHRPLADERISVKLLASQPVTSFTAAGLNTALFLANSPYLYDGSHIADGFSTYSASFVRFFVVASRIRVDFANIGAGFALVTLRPSATGIIGSSGEVEAAQPLAKSALLSIFPQERAACTMVSKQNTASMQGFTDVAQSALTWTGLAGSLPAVPAQLNYWILSMESAAALQVYTRVLVEFDVVFSQRRVL